MASIRPPPPKTKAEAAPSSMSTGNVAQTPVVSGALGPVISVCVQVAFRMAGDYAEVNQRIRRVHAGVAKCSSQDWFQKEKYKSYIALCCQVSLVSFNPEEIFHILSFVTLKYLKSYKSVIL